MVSVKIINECIKWCILNIKGNMSEKIIQNAMVHRLQKLGVLCQQEVVMPVLAGNIFVGYNRLDVFIPGESKKKKQITILELKLLANSIKNGFKGSRIEGQCIGYQKCTRRIFGKETDVRVFVVNVWRVAGKQSTYKFEVVQVEQAKASSVRKKR